jgi:LssY C-terminus
MGRSAAAKPPPRERRPRRSRATLAVAAAAAALATYALLAYGVLPWLWWEHERRRHPALDAVPKVTRNADGIPGDPLNVGLVGGRAQVVHAMLAAGWRPADAVTVHSSLEIAASVLLDRPDPDAPVSPLYVFGRKQDLAFEREVGSSADRRHHVRWWRADRLDEADRPLWIGSASFDIGAGFSHLTGQITHHIDADVDAERDRLMDDLERAGQLVRQYDSPGVGATEAGRNAEGDRYFTDGMVDVGVLAPGNGRP